MNQRNSASVILKEKTFVWLKRTAFTNASLFDNATLQRAILCSDFQVPGCLHPGIGLLQKRDCSQTQRKNSTLVDLKVTFVSDRVFCENILQPSWLYKFARAASLNSLEVSGRVDWKGGRRWEFMVFPGDPDAPFFSKLMHPLRFGDPCMFGWRATCASRSSFSFWCWIWFKRNIPFDHFGLFYSMPPWFQHLQPRMNFWRCLKYVDTMLIHINQRISICSLHIETSLPKPSVWVSNFSLQLCLWWVFGGPNFHTRKILTRHESGVRVFSWTSLH